MNTDFIICRFCGVENLIEDKFCGICKKSLHNDIDEFIVENSSQKKYFKINDSKKIIKPHFKIGCFWQVFLLIFAFTVISNILFPIWNKYSERKRIEKLAKETNTECYYDFTLKNEKPYYLGEEGYIICTNGDELLSVKPPWKIPILVQRNGSWEKSKFYIEVKQKAIVLEERVTERPEPYRDGTTTDYLKVKLLNSGKECWINTSNFSKVKYWECPLKKSVNSGCILAETNSTTLKYNSFVKLKGRLYVFFDRKGMSSEYGWLLDANFKFLYHERFYFDMNEVDFVY